MITVKIQTKGLADLLKKQIDLIKDKEKLMRYLAVSMIPEVRVRVHQDGLDSNGQRIGTYSPAYMKVRTGNYSNALARSTSSKIRAVRNEDGSESFFSGAGFYTRGKKAVFNIKSKKAVKTKASQRPRYNRTSDTKVILSLTRQMENDMTAIPTPTGYGIGYLNPFNAQKARWGESTYKKTIWDLTKEEEDLVFRLTDQYLKNNAKA